MFSTATTLIAETGRLEAELLICCLQARKDSRTDARVRELLQEEIDWQDLLQRAGEHGVLPLLFCCLEKFSELIPPSVLDEFRSLARQDELRNLVLAAELLNLLDLLERHEIPTLPYKGPVLATSVYGNLALRKPGDLDLLLRQKDIQRARNLLLSQGYVPMSRPDLPTSGMTHAQEAAFFHFEREYGFTHKDLDIDVELQWRIMPRYFSFPLKVEDLRKRLQRVAFGGRYVHTISLEDLLLILCVHGSKHLWERLQWICDVAEVLTTQPEIDWHWLVKEATRLGSRRMLFLGLFLASDLLGAELPEGLSREIRSDPMVEELSGEVYTWLFRESEDPRNLLEGSAFCPFHFKARERLRDKILYWARTVITPNCSDWLDWPLPKGFFSLYYVLRPVRLVKKYGKRLSGVLAQ